MKDLIKRGMLVGAGLISLTKEKIESAIDELVKKGELSEKEGKEVVSDLLEKSKEFGKEFTDKIDKGVKDVLSRLNIPSRKEFDELKKKIEELEKDQGKKE